MYVTDGTIKKLAPFLQIFGALSIFRPPTPKMVVTPLLERLEPFKYHNCNCCHQNHYHIAKSNSSHAVSCLETRVFSQLKLILAFSMTFCVHFYLFLLWLTSRSSKNCMTISNIKCVYQIINAYFTFNASHPSLSRCRNIQQHELIATAFFHSRIDYCNSLFLNLPSYQLNLLLLLLNPATPPLRPCT